jgi:GxxExxY protein
VALPVVYDKMRMESSLRLDLLVDERVIVEVKAVETLAAIHTAQMLTYLKLSSLRLGLLMNFNVRLIKDGIKRVAL